MAEADGVTSDELRAMRAQAGLSQRELAARLGTTQGSISSWETGQASIPHHRVPQICTACGVDPTADLVAAEMNVDGYGGWLAATRIARGLSRQQLAEQAGVVYQIVYNIETGKTLNPRAQTRQRLERALSDEPSRETVAEFEAEAAIEGLGALTDFDPHSPDDHPTEAGVYVFYDISERPIYVGESKSIKRRIRDHSDKFWFRPPIVHTAAFVPVEEDRLRRSLEAALIKFLKSNAVINQKSVDR